MDVLEELPREEDSWFWLTVLKFSVQDEVSIEGPGAEDGSQGHSGGREKWGGCWSLDAKWSLLVKPQEFDHGLHDPTNPTHPTQPYPIQPNPTNPPNLSNPTQSNPTQPTT